MQNEKPKKRYEGRRLNEGCEVYVINEADGSRYPLPTHWDIYNHSPTGFEWGYSGSGPAQLALAILADHFGPDKEPEKCPFCDGPVKDWKCAREDEQQVGCGYDGEKEGDKWKSITGGIDRGAIHYQVFKRDVVALWSKDWVITTKQIDEWVEYARREAA